MPVETRDPSVRSCVGRAIIKRAPLSNERSSEPRFPSKANLRRHTISFGGNDHEDASKLCVGALVLLTSGALLERVDKLELEGNWMIRRYWYVS